MATPSAPPFVAIELKKTHHVLGLLSRVADSSGGNDLASLAPRSLGVRAPIHDPVATPSVPPLSIRVPSDLLQATAVTGATPDERDQAFSNPLGSALVGSKIVPTPVGTAAPSLGFAASLNGLITEFAMTLPNSVAEDLKYTVIIQEAMPAPNTVAFMRITESTVPAGDAGQLNVTIRAAGDSSSAPSPIPANVWVYYMLAVPGYPLVLMAVRPA